MLETLTARELLSVLNFETVERLFIDAFTTGNVTVLYAVADNIKERKRQDLFSELIVRAYATGFGMSYCSPVREALINILDEAKKDHPLNWLNYDIVLGKWKESSDLTLTNEDYCALISAHSEEYYDNFCLSMTPYEFVSMDQKMLDILKSHYDYYGEKGILDGEISEPKDPTDRKHLIDDNTQYLLRRTFKKQIDVVEDDEQLADEMMKKNYKIFEYFDVRKPILVNVTF